MKALEAFNRRSGFRSPMTGTQPSRLRSLSRFKPILASSINQTRLLASESR
jgi:hypothetical protein